MFTHQLDADASVLRRVPLCPVSSVLVSSDSGWKRPCFKRWQVRSLLLSCPASRHRASSLTHSTFPPSQPALPTSTPPAPSSTCTCSPRCSKWKSTILSDLNKTFTFPPLPRTRIFDTHPLPLPTGRRAQALLRYISDPFPRHPHLPLRFLYVSAAPRAWPPDPLDGRLLLPWLDESLEEEYDVEMLAEVEILDRDRAPLARLRMQMYSGNPDANEGMMVTYRRSGTGVFVAGTETMGDSETLFVCVDRELRGAFRLEPGLPSAVDVVTEMERVDMQSIGEAQDDWGSDARRETALADGVPCPYFDWAVMGAPWHTDEAEDEGVEAGGGEAAAEKKRNVRRLCRMAYSLSGIGLEHKSDIELILAIAERMAWHLSRCPYLPRDCIAFWADAIWSCRSGTYLAKLPRELFDQIVGHVDCSPFIVPWLFWE
ncbi:hypothetical protein BDK51DRAFT_46321 [Blyttiomyces helicus]|uniref:Uncharacterized protein n=1 Tax=Blyttiomyces helicus TaxID=388810 RepID=A0A4P9WDA4_9FUNG|nr:hypothetical protein BDK51DRAFT_46321 [Blyttiomyces helicus]|eukprot:RKO88356.1 hypothetical protein BDK51DRAFT_46321 [Blyttiomyces helicus]